MGISTEKLVPVVSPTICTVSGTTGGWTIKLGALAELLTT